MVSGIPDARNRFPTERLPLDRSASADYAPPLCPPDPADQRSAKETAAMAFYDRGNVRIHYEDAGSGFPLLVIPGGGLNSTIAGLSTHPFNPFDEFSGRYRV